MEMKSNQIQLHPHLTVHDASYMMDDFSQECVICGDESIDELQCADCKHCLHFTCALGFEPPDEFKASDLKSEYICPPCLCGSTDALLHQAMDVRVRKRVSITVRSPSLVHSEHVMMREHDHEDSASDISDIHSHTHVSAVVESQHDVTNASVCNISTPQLNGDKSEIVVPPTQTGIRNKVKNNTGERNPNSQRKPPQSVENAPPPGNFSPDSFINVHEYCASKGKRLSYILRSMSSNLPSQATSVCIADSLSHCLNKKEIDPENDTFRVRSVGGLCVVGVVQSLMRHRRRHPKIKHVIYSLGINDHLHRENHCLDERAKYFKALQAESLRVFPNAIISFVLPFKGMVGNDINDQVQEDLTQLLEENCPKIRRYDPPSLQGKVDKKGIHPNWAGKKMLTAFFHNTFGHSNKGRVFSQNSGRRTPDATYATAHLPAEAQIHENFRVRPQVQPAPVYKQEQLNQVQQAPVVPGGLAMEIAQAFTHVMRSWAQQPHFQMPINNPGIPGPWPPPMAPFNRV